ncbi:MAG: hypothetical protein ACUVWP_09485 [bacterium]
MRNLLTFVLCFITISSVISYNEKDMKYHEEPYNFYTFLTPDYAFACYFKLSDFSITGFDYKIKIIGFMGYESDGPADIYVTSKEIWDGNKYVPICNPKNHWKGAEYGPKSWHINNSYPKYDDCNLYNDNWHYSKDVNKFWCIYHLKTSSPPYPIADMISINDIKIINSITWIPGEGWDFWSYGILGHPGNWCMHCVIVYWGSNIENTSLGAVKALFKYY